MSSLFFVSILLMWPLDKSTGKIDRVCTPVGWFAFETMTTDAGPAPPVAGVVVSGILSSLSCGRIGHDLLTVSAVARQVTKNLECLYRHGEGASRGRLS